MFYLLSAISCILCLSLSIHLPLRILKSISAATERFKKQEDLALCGHWLAAKANVVAAEKIINSDHSLNHFTNISCRNENLNYRVILVSQSNPKLPDTWPNFIPRVSLNKEDNHAF